jgi:pyruvate dehydrogenase E2 component (dihydrolipoamide acetyltransferase)
MPVSVTMPRLGESVTEGTVTRWLKKEGERVEVDEPLLEVSTDKVDTEIPAPAAGVVTKITVGEDETVEVGAELAVIDEAGSGGASDTAAEPPAQPTTEPEPEPEPAAEPAAEEPQPTPAAAEEKPPAVAEAETSSVDTSAAPPPAESADPPPAASSDGKAPYLTPLVRKLAAEHGVDPATLTGTGAGGRITKQDVLGAARGGTRAPAAAAAAPTGTTSRTPAASAPTRQPSTAGSTATSARTDVRGRTEKLSRLRAVIADRMVESLQTSAQLTTVVEVDVTRVARLRDRAKGAFEAREGTKLSFLPFFAVAAVEALKAHPVLNASIDTAAGTVTYHDAVHLGMAVDTDRGLLVPVIHDAGDLNIGGLARKIADLAERTRSNKIAPDELGGGTFTLTNTGSRGALFDTPILNQPQVAILGTGSVVKRPVVVDDPDLGEVIAVRSMVYLALTYDHRLVDGADAARYLSTVKGRLEDGRFEASLGLDPE